MGTEEVCESCEDGHMLNISDSYRSMKQTWLCDTCGVIQVIGQMGKRRILNGDTLLYQGKISLTKLQDLKQP